MYALTLIISPITNIIADDMFESTATQYVITLQYRSIFEKLIKKPSVQPCPQKSFILHPTLLHRLPKLEKYIKSFENWPSLIMTEHHQVGERQADLKIKSY